MTKVTMTLQWGWWENTVAPRHNGPKSSRNPPKMEMKSWSLHTCLNSRTWLQPALSVCPLVHWSIGQLAHLWVETSIKLFIPFFGVQNYRRLLHYHSCQNAWPISLPLPTSPDLGGRVSSLVIFYIGDIRNPLITDEIGWSRGNQPTQSLHEIL